MQKYQDNVFKPTGGVARYATVTVQTYPAGTNATIYSDDGVTTQTNPITCDENGFFAFYAEDGRYQLVISGTGITTKTITDIVLQESINVKYYGALGNGIADDSTAIQAAVTATITNGGIIYFPPGTYNMGTGISTSGIGVGGKAVTLQGAGVNATIFNRLNGCGNIFNFRNIPDGSAMRDFTINCNAIANPTSAAQTIVMGEASDVLIENIVINEPRNSGVLILSEAVSPRVSAPNIKNCLVRNVKVNGSTPSGLYKGIDVGILIAGTNVTNSGIVDCQVTKVGTDVSLSPGVGIELKYTGANCYISNCYVEDAIQGFGFATDGSNNCPYVRLNNLHAKACITGLYGYLDDSVIDNVIVDNNNVSGLLEPFQIVGSRSTFSNLSIKNMLNAAKYHLRFIAPASNNYVHVGTIYNTNSVQTLASFEATCTGNVVRVGRMSLPVITSMLATNLVSDSSSPKSNRVSIDGLPELGSRTIATGAVAVTTNLEMLTVDTEGAAATDDLDNITGGVDGQTVTVRTTSNARDVVVRHNGGGTGNINLVGGVNFTLSTVNYSMVLCYSSATSLWNEISRAAI